MRNRAIQHMAPVLFMMGLAGCTTQAGLIDSHVHLNDVAMQVALMDEFGVDRAVVFWGARSTDETILEAAAQHPGRFIPFASISPERTAFRPMWQRDDAKILARLESLLATGRFRGIGEISVVHDATAGFAATAFSPLSPTMRGIMDLARRHRIPVMVHCERSHLEPLGELLQAYRDVPVIWAHGGYTDASTARRMLERHPNLYYELSARTWPRHPRSEAYTIMPGNQLAAEWKVLVESMPGRFLVGSDASHRSLDSEKMKARSVRDFLDQLSPAARREVAGGTLERLLGPAR
jgi:Tat protein secretion system quality control protein TatD with DNase activity